MISNTIFTLDLLSFSSLSLPQNILTLTVQILMVWKRNVKATPETQHHHWDHSVYLMHLIKSVHYYFGDQKKKKWKTNIQQIRQPVEVEFLHLLFAKTNKNWCKTCTRKTEKIPSHFENTILQEYHHEM